MPSLAEPPSVTVVTITKNDPDVSVTVGRVLQELDQYPGSADLLVVDATPGTPHRDERPGLRWIPFTSQGHKATIPEQRNLAVAESSGDFVLFIDSGCIPEPGWLGRMMRPAREDGELIVAGAHTSAERASIRDQDLDFRHGADYLREAPTINLAVARTVFETAGGFDESFGYGSDVDFTWRAVAAGYRIRHEPSAVVSHDWGSALGDLRRSWVYGQARLRLYLKHAEHRSRIMKDDPIAVIYPVFLLALLLSRGNRRVLAMAAVPVLKNARRHPLLTLAHNLAFGAGILAGAARRLNGIAGA